MTDVKFQSPQRSYAFTIFVLALTVLSLLIMVASLLPLSEPTLQLLWYYDTIICIIFLIDFFYSLATAPDKTEYFIPFRISKMHSFNWDSSRGQFINDRYIQISI